MSCGGGSRQDSDPELLWLWHRLTAAALIQPLAWEPPSVTGAALKRIEKKKKRVKRRKRTPIRNLLRNSSEQWYALNQSRNKRSRKFGGYMSLYLR